MINSFLTAASSLAKPTPTCPHECGQAGVAFFVKAFSRIATAKAFKCALAHKTFAVAIFFRSLNHYPQKPPTLASYRQQGQAAKNPMIAFFPEEKSPAYRY
jgi:hypothetical protein